MHNHRLHHNGLSQPCFEIKMQNPGHRINMLGGVKEIICALNSWQISEEEKEHKLGPVIRIAHCLADRATARKTIPSSRARSSESGFSQPIMERRTMAGAAAAGVRRV